LDIRRNEDEKMSRGVWKVVEIKIGEVRMAKAKRGREK